jgi:hypothetical protein
MLAFPQRLLFENVPSKMVDCKGQKTSFFVAFFFPRTSIAWLCGTLKVLVCNDVTCDVALCSGLLGRL